MSSLMCEPLCLQMLLLFILVTAEQQTFSGADGETESGVNELVLREPQSGPCKCRPALLFV